MCYNVSYCLTIVLHIAIILLQMSLQQQNQVVVLDVVLFSVLMIMCDTSKVYKQIKSNKTPPNLSALKQCTLKNCIHI